MKHQFYVKTPRQQNRIQLLIGLTAFFIILIASLISWLSGIYLIVIVLFPVVLSIIAPFFDTPSLKKSGALRYHSLLFLSERPKNGLIKIHGGTLFDYVFVIDNKLNGKQRVSFIIQQYLEGLLNLIEKNGEERSDDITIRGTSYIINERTARRLGFKVVKTDAIKRLILILNYFNVLLTFSFAKGKLSFPRLNRTRTFEAKLTDLSEHKYQLQKLNNRLKRKVSLAGINP